MSDKITLAPGQQSAQYDFEAQSFEELGAKLDKFYYDIDYNKAHPHSGVSVSVNVSVLRSWQYGVERVSIGGHSASVIVERRE